MKVRYTTTVVSDVKYLKVKINEPNWEDYIFNGKTVEGFYDLPPWMLSKDKAIEFYVDIEDGYIREWVVGNTLSTCDKVRDGGDYWLTDEYLNVLIGSNNYYVPKMLDIKGDGYGDYVQFEVNEEGYIKDWKINFDDFDIEILS